MMRGALGWGILIAAGIIFFAGLLGSATDDRKRGECKRGEVRIEKGVCVDRDDYSGGAGNRTGPSPAESRNR
jgi:hypothetical protein